jgi:hypothetical protein
VTGLPGRGWGNCCRRRDGAYDILGFEVFPFLAGDSGHHEECVLYAHWECDYSNKIHPLEIDLIRNMSLKGRNAALPPTLRMSRAHGRILSYVKVVPRPVIGIESRLSLAGNPGVPIIEYEVLIEPGSSSHVQPFSC